MPLDMFNGPIPGQSLTKPLGAMPHDNPPQYADLNDALEHMWDVLTQPRQATRLILMLKKRLPAEYIARSIIFMGFGKGMWTPDVGLMMLKSVIGMITTIAKLKNVKHIILNPDKEQNDFLDKFLDMVSQDGEDTSSDIPPAAPKQFSGILGGSA